MFEVFCQQFLCRFFISSHFFVKLGAKKQRKLSRDRCDSLSVSCCSLGIFFSVVFISSFLAKFFLSLDCNKVKCKIFTNWFLPTLFVSFSLIKINCELTKVKRKQENSKSTYNKREQKLLSRQENQWKSLLIETKLISLGSVAGESDQTKKKRTRKKQLREN